MALPDPEISRQFVKYARMLAARGYIHNTLGNVVMRQALAGYPHGVAYTKPSGMSLEEVEAADLVVTDVPTSRIVHGAGMTSIGHNLSREILRLRPDIHATIHVHDDDLIAFFGSGAFGEVKILSLDLPFVLGKPIHYVPAHVDVEADVSGVKDFIQGTNSVVLLGHGITTLGRNVSEAYHRLNSLTAEIRRNVAAELLALAKGSTPHYRGQAEIESMYRFAESIIYPKRAERVMHED
jgi:ribulose-5-phosphate 4-epimerase/fuculose-1-phosphate aldolase